MLVRSFQSAFIVPALLASFLLAACGGGDSSAPSNANGTSTATSPAPADPNVPKVTGNTATDGFNWFNYRRQQIGIQVLARNSRIDAAAQGHSDYEKLNDAITHTQTTGKPGFTGADLLDRLTAAGYGFTVGSYAYGEVLSSMGDASGVNAAEDLITAIYHRFVIFEPMFKEAGAGAATSSSGYTYFTHDFASNGLNTGLGSGKFANYPVAGQQSVPTNFFSDNESPDPVPNQNEVGYPISVHADIVATVKVQTFTVAPRGGALLPVRLLSTATDTKTPTSAAAIIPLSVLAARTTYDVQFIGTVDGIAANRVWSFTTR